MTDYLKKQALFLDRDGVINEDFGYVFRINDFQFKPGIFDLVKLANNNKWLVIVITNQSGIARGFYDESDFWSVTKWMREQFIQKGAFIDDVYFCPHHPTKGNASYTTACECRKPKPGMITQAVKEHNIDIAKSVLLGDKISDIQAGIAAGITQNYWLCSSDCLDIEFTEKHADKVRLVKTFDQVLLNPQ